MYLDFYCGIVALFSLKFTVKNGLKQLLIWVQVVREHDPLGRDVELFRRHLYPSEKGAPTVKGQIGAELVDGLVIEEGDYKLVKTRFSAFFATHLDSFLKGVGIDSLVVTGEKDIRL